MPRRERIADILGELHEREHDGGPLDLEHVLREHPDLADELRAHVEALELIDGSFGDGAGRAEDLPDHIGAYRVERELGQGGMGTVYLARGHDGREVALKVVHPHLLGRGAFFQRFLREAQVGRSVQHENVVRTLRAEAAPLGGRTAHFLVVEYVRGKTLRALGRELGTVPEALLREIALQVAAGLAAIHAAGIVHRDLKPENLLITEDHRVRIMDLGVARALHESLALTREGQFAGSVCYAAPEQFGGAHVGPAADLYALGVLLYELATGENPFRVDGTAAVMRAHLEHVPPRLRERVPEVSEFLSELVATLLEKQPEARIRSAATLREILEHGEETTWWSERERDVARRRRHVPTVPVRRETRLYGRETELALVQNAWRRAREGEGNTVLLEGEAGIGKSRLVDACLQALGGANAQVLYGSHPPAGGLGAISDALLGRFGSGDLSGRLAPYLAVAPSLAPGLAALLRHEDPPPGAQSLENDALHAACVHVMRALAAERPLVWVVEDLHFAGRQGRQLALSLARAVEGHRVLLLLTTRPGLPEAELAHFGRIEGFQRSGLARLGARDVVLLLKDAFRSERLAEKLGVRIALKSDGVPFFVFEMIRGLKEGQFVAESPDGSWVESKVINDIEVPTAVKDLIEVRLRGLSDEERIILDVGAVEGFEFDPGLVAAVLGTKRVHVLQRLAATERRSGVVRATGRRYQFDHHQIQEVAEAGLPLGLKEEYHTLLANAYAEEIRGELSGEDRAFLALHHLQGGRPESGLPHLLPALEHLSSAHRGDATLELATRALAAPILLRGTERSATLLELAAQHELRGEWDVELGALEEARALADGTEDLALRATVRAALGRHWSRVADYDLAQAVLGEALDLAGRAGASRLEAGIVRSLGLIQLSQGDLNAALETFQGSLAAARDAKDADGEAANLINVGLVLTRLGRFDEARTSLERGLVRAQDAGNRSWERNAVGNLGIVVLYSGDPETARIRFLEHVALSRELGDRLGEAQGTLNLGQASLALGRIEEASGHFGRSIALFGAFGHRRGLARATGSLGLVLHIQGRYEEAWDHFETRLSLAREIGDREIEANGERCLAALCADLGRNEEAKVRLTRGLEVAREAGDRMVEGMILGAFVALASASGSRERARQLAEDALGVLRDVEVKGPLARTLVTLGCAEIESDDLESATAHLEEGMALAAEFEAHPTLLLGAIHRARLPGGNLEAALSTFERYEVRADHRLRMEARFHLWRLTHDGAHLAEAKRLLDFAVAHAPEACHTTMIEGVPLNHEIVEAWERYGTQADR